MLDVAWWLVIPIVGGIAMVLAPIIVLTLLLDGPEEPGRGDAE